MREVDVKYARETQMRNKEMARLIPIQLVILGSAHYDGEVSLLRNADEA